ncbi:MAG TPA: PilN domain-containing protein [Burkholderiales bacterium]|jgi:type IV pilus assembly protein PilN|nr:PilN domain-containing protein [Burkholderiales bacterium]
MIPINLLPHRAARRKAAQQQFAILAGMTVALAGAIVVLVHLSFADRIENQMERNRFLENEIATLDKQIDEIKKLKEQTAALLARKRVVESLQTNRTETVRLLDQLVRQLPDGVYLKSIKQSGQTVTVIGYASSNARVSTLMRNFEASPWLESPSLVEIKASKVGKENTPINEFNLTVKISRPKEETVAAPRPAAATQPPKS